MKYIIYSGVVIGFLTILVFGFNFFQKEPLIAFSFDECVTQGNAVMESYPRQCIDGAGTLHVEDVTSDWEIMYVNASDDLIRNVNIEAGDTVSSPLTITGEARGYWFFESSFPVTIVDWDGLIIGETFASAEGEWMTEDFVPFTVVIDFETPEQVTPVNRGAIILSRENPSGLSENDGALEIPIVFE